MGVEYQAAECGLGAAESDWRPMRGKEEASSEWQKDECAQDIKLIETKTLHSDGGRMCQRYGQIVELRSYMQ